MYLLLSAAGAAAPPALSTTVAPLDYVENDPATAVDAALTVNEPDGDDVLSATVRITGNYAPGEDVLAFADQLGISGAWNPAVGVLTLSGTAPAADYETALRAVTYQNTSDDPSTAARTVQFVVTDVNSESGSATRDVTVAAVDDPLDLTTTSGSLAYVEGAAATALDPGLTVVDVDDAVTGATVQITGDYAAGEDVLSFTDQLGISGAWDPGTGTLTLSGTAPASDYQTALRTVAYADASDAPSTSPRAVTFTVVSATTDSAVRVVAITAVNDPPSAGGATTVTDPGGGPATVLEDGVAASANIRLAPPTLADVDGPVPTQVRVLSVTGGTLHQADGSVVGLGAGGSLLDLAGGAVDLRFTPDPDRDVDASFDYVVVDGANAGVNSGPSTATVPIVAVNDPPVLATSGGSAAFTENGPAVAVDASLTTSDVDDAALEGATVVISGGYVAGEDALAFADQLGITGAWDAGSGTLTLSGTAAVADYETALRTVTYANASDAPSTGPRTVTVQVDDGSDPSAPAARTVTVTATNDPPTVATASGAASYTENASPVVLDAGIVTGDVDSALLEGATLAITVGYAAGEDALAFADQLGISGSWDAASGTLTLTGSAPVADYETALRTVTYVDTSDAPSTAVRTVTVTVTDGTDTSAAGTRDVDVVAVNDPPILTGTGGTFTYTENSVPVVVDGGITLDDADDATVASATVAIAGGYWNGEDVLAFTDQLGISGAWDAGTGTLTLTGSAPVADYETALRTVTYANTSDAPASAARTVEVTVHDGDALGNPVSRVVAVVPVNDPPVATLAAGAVGYTEGAAAVPLDGTLTVADPDDAALTRARLRITSGYSAAHDVLSATAAGGVAVDWDAASGVLTLEGAASPSTYRTLLRGVRFRNTAQDPSTAARTVTVVLYDASGPGPAASRVVTVTAVNDAPAAARDAATTLQDRAVVVDVLANDVDADGDRLTVAAVAPSPDATASLTADGRVRVEPRPAFTGTATVPYTVTDGAATDTGSISIAVVPAADLAVSAGAWPDSVAEGDTVRVDVVVRNGGPGTAFAPFVDADAGDGHRVVGAATAGGSCAAGGRTARCELPDVVASASALVELHVVASTTGTMRVQVRAASSSADPDPTGDAEVVVLVGPRRVAPPLVPARPGPPDPAPPTTAAGPVRPPRTTPSTTTPPPAATAGPAPAAGAEAPTGEEGVPAALSALVVVLAATVGASVVGLRRVTRR